MTITRDWLQKQIAEFESCAERTDGYRLDEGGKNTLEAMRIALASLEAEAVHQFIYNNPYEEGYTEWLDCNKDYFDGVPEDCRRVLYTAPPAPVSVPTFDEWLEIRGNKPLGWVKDAMRESYDACRAAMRGKAEPVSQPSTLRDGVESLRSSGISIDAGKTMAERDALNSSATPDGWVMVPVEPTAEMYDAGDRQLATKQVWDAMLAAAPQQEVKP